MGVVQDLKPLHGFSFCLWSSTRAIKNCSGKMPRRKIRVTNRKKTMAYNEHHPTKGTNMKVLKKFLMAVAFTYAFIFAMMIGLIVMTNMLLAS